jgi:diguanylate cyclase (GGDEF)-like protein
MSKTRRPNRRTRYLALGAVLVAALVAFGLVLLDRKQGYARLLEHETLGHGAVARALVGSAWARYAGLVAAAPTMSRAELLRRDEVRALSAEAAARLAGTHVARVDLRSLDGLTVLSTDTARIGEDRSGDARFVGAKAGRRSSELLFREPGRVLVGSFTPLRGNGGPNGAAPVEAVVEIVSDVTPLAAGIERAARANALWAAGGVLGLALLLFFAVMRAERFLRAQEIERAASEARLRHHAYHDQLTGLPNRANLMERLDEATKLSALAERKFALLLVELDRLKTIREGLGQDAGNELVNVVARRLRDCLREGDVVFRVGAGEFALLVEDLANPGDAAFVARRVIEACAEPIRVDEHDVSTAASVGITVFPDDDRVPERLVRNAVAAMHRAKEAGRGRYDFYTPEMNLRALQRLELESALLSALGNREFVLHYQPRVDAVTHEVVAVEALLRWRHPKLGLVAPDRFVDLLEDTGLILPVGEWVLETACTQAASWRRSGYPGLRVAVNVSPHQFRSGTLVATVRRALEACGLPAAALELELSESLLVESADEAVKLLEDLKRLGVCLSIDDFGAGYTSLGYLKQFPVDYLKLDRGLVKGVPESDKDCAIVAAVGAMTGALRVGLVAEGIERKPQAEFLARHRCQEMQGELFGRPVPAGELERILAGERRRGTLLGEDGWAIRAGPSVRVEAGPSTQH